MKLSDDLTAEQHAALVECVRLAARRGRHLREERERLEKENRQDAGTAGDSPNDSAMMKESLHE